MNQKRNVISGDFGLEHLAAGQSNPQVDGDSNTAYPQMDSTSRVQPLAFGLQGVAEALSLSLSTVKSLVHEGALASIRVGRRRLVSRAELERFLALREEENRLTERARSQIEARILGLQAMLDGLGGGG